MILILKYVYAILQTIFFSCLSLIMTIITGKMSKISTYHFDKQSHLNGVFDITSDRYIKVRNKDLISPECKKSIINDFIEQLRKDDNFRKPLSEVDFPMFDGKEIYGSRGVFQVIDECLEKYTKI